MPPFSDSSWSLYSCPGVCTAEDMAIPFSLFGLFRQGNTFTSQSAWGSGLATVGIHGWAGHVARVFRWAGTPLMLWDQVGLLAGFCGWAGLLAGLHSQTGMLIGLCSQALLDSLVGWGYRLGSWLGSAIGWTLQLDGVTGWALKAD